MSDKAAEVFLRTPETDPSSGRHPEPAPVRRTRARLALAAICGAMLLAMMGLTVADVLGRYLLGAPITGATELTEMMLAAVIFLGLPAVSLDRDHVTVDIVTEHLPARLQPWRELLAALVSAAMLSVVGWRIWVYAGQIAGYSGATNSLRLPIAPLGYLAAACCALGAVFTLYAALRGLRRK